MIKILLHPISVRAMIFFYLFIISYLPIYICDCKLLKLALNEIKKRILIPLKNSYREPH